MYKIWIIFKSTWKKKSIISNTNSWIIAPEMLFTSYWFFGWVLDSLPTRLTWNYFFIFLFNNDSLNRWSWIGFVELKIIELKKNQNYHSKFPSLQQLLFKTKANQQPIIWKLITFKNYFNCWCCCCCYFSSCSSQVRCFLFHWTGLLL